MEMQLLSQFPVVLVLPAIELLAAAQCVGLPVSCDIFPVPAALP